MARAGGGRRPYHGARVEDDRHDLAVLQARVAGALRGEQLAEVRDAAVGGGEADIPLEHHAPLLQAGFIVQCLMAAGEGAPFPNSAAFGDGGAVRAMKTSDWVCASC